MQWQSFNKMLKDKTKLKRDKTKLKMSLIETMQYIYIQLYIYTCEWNE